MKRPGPKALLIAAALGCTGGVALAAHVDTGDSGTESFESAALARDAAASGVRIIRGPRGFRGYRGFRGFRGRTGLRGRTGARGAQGVTGPAGPAGTPGSDHALNLTINWRNGAATGRDSASVAVPGIGTLTAVCNPASQRLTLAPAASGTVRTTASVTSFESSSSTHEQPYSEDGSPIILGSPTQPGHALPPNGMLQGTLSVQPRTGDGGSGPAPATLTLSSEYKINDPDASKNFCFVAGQVLTAGR